MSVGGTPLRRLDLDRHQRPRDRPNTGSFRPTIRTPSRSSSRRAKPALQYDIEEGGDVFFILTNADGAKDFKIVTAPVGRSAPRQLDGPRAARAGPADPVDAVVQGFPGPAGAQGRAAAHRRARTRDRRRACRSPSTRRPISLGLSGSYEYDTDIMRFSYSSMTTPAQLFDYNMRTRERTLLKTQEVPSGHDAGPLCHAPPDGAGP